MKIVGGPSSLQLANRIGNMLNIPLISVKTKRFPDGEFYLKFEENLSGKDLLIVQSLYPPQDTHFMELLLILHTTRDLGARSIKVFVPYLAYSRQDERYLDGECLSSAMISEIFERLGVDALFTIDVHNQKVLKMYNIPSYNLTAAGELVKYFVAKNLKNPLVVSPDDETIAIQRAKYAAKIIGAEYNFFGKKRNKHTGEIKTFSKELNVKGRDAIIIDDIISTAKTSANATRILKDQGARNVYVGVSHALLHGNAQKILEMSGADEIVGTDCVVNEFAKVSVAPILVNAL